MLKYCVQVRFLLIHFYVVLILLMGTNVSMAQLSQKPTITRTEIPSSFNPVGSGARALGMGGAFIAVADDATAASWNPGGLIQLETPEISIVGASVFRTETNSFGTTYDTEDEQTSTNSNINYLSAAYPFTALNRNMIVSANHQYLYDFNRSLDYPIDYGTTNFTYTGNGEARHEGGLSAIGVAYAVEITPRFSFGFTLNFWQDGLYGNELNSKFTESGTGVVNGNDFSLDFNSSDEFSYRGYNFNLGILWNLTRQLTIGVVFKSPFTMQVERSHEEDLSFTVPDNPTLNFSDNIEDDYDEELDLPMSYGVGLAYRFTDTLTISLDLYRTEWGDMTLTDEDGTETSPITGEPIDDSDISPTHQIRSGIEYLLLLDPYIIPIRGGLFYDPAPAEDDPDNFYGFSCGTGLSKDSVILDIAYQYRFASDAAEYILENWDFSQDVSEHTFYASIIYHF